MVQTLRSYPRAVLPPEETSPEQGDTDPTLSTSLDFRPAIRNLLGMLFRFIQQQRIGALQDPSHALLEARHADFLDRVYGGDSGGFGGFALQLVDQSPGGTL